jgi:hypothetical protein
MKIKNWIACYQDRGKWKEVVEKAKTFNWEEEEEEEEKKKEEEKKEEKKKKKKKFSNCEIHYIIFSSPLFLEL